MANEVSVIIRAKDFASKVFKGMEANVRSFARLSKDVARDLTAIAAGAGAALLGVTKLAQRGGDYTGVQLAFNRITGDGAAALANLQAATGGVISSFDLMQRYNVAVSRGSVKNIDEFGKLAKISASLGDVIGDDAAAFDVLSEAVSRGNAKAASGLGIMVDQEKAHADYAKSLGKEVKELTELEKKRATGNAILEEGARIAKDIAGDMPAGAEAADRLATSIANIKDALATLVAMSPVVSGFFTDLENWLFTASGGNLDARADIAQLAGITDPKALAAARRTRLSEGQAISSRVIQMRADLEANPLSARERREVGMSGGTRRTGDLAAAEAKLAALQQSIAFLDAKLRPASAPDAGGSGSGAGDEEATKLQQRIQLRQMELDKVNALAGLENASATQVELLNKAHDYGIERQKLLNDLKGEELRIALAILDANVRNDPLVKALGVTGNIPAGVLPFRAAPSLANAGGPPPAILERAAGSKEFGERMSGILGMTNQSVGASMERLAKGEKERGDAALDAARQMDEAKGLVVASLGGMAVAAIEGSKITAQSITGMLANIIQSIPGVGGLAGSLIGAGLGIVGGLFSRGNRDDKPVAVKIADVDAAAQRKLEGHRPPQNIVYNLHLPDGSLGSLEKLETELRRRQRRDAVSRIPRGSSPTAP